MLRKAFMFGLGAILIGALSWTQSSAQDNSPVKVAVGKPAPVFSGALLDEKTLKLDELLKEKDKIVLVDFWATWCPPCRGEIPHLQEAHKEFSKKGLVIISVNVNEPANTIQAFTKKTKMPWHHVLDVNGKISTLYGVNSIPAPFLIDQNGVLVAKDSDLRGSQLKKTLKKYTDKLPKKDSKEISQG